MKNRLSAGKYIKNNKRTCFVLIIALALTLMAMYTVAFTLYTAIESFKPICHEMPKKIAYVSLSYESFGTPKGLYNCGWFITILCNEETAHFSKLAYAA